MNGDRSPCVTSVANTTIINATWINSCYNIVLSDHLEYEHTNLEKRIMYHTTTQLQDSLQINVIVA